MADCLFFYVAVETCCGQKCVVIVLYRIASRAMPTKRSSLVISRDDRSANNILTLLADPICCHEHKETVCALTPF